MAQRAWQVECLKKMKSYLIEGKKDFLVAATPGSGKTRLALQFAADLIKEGTANHIHIVAPTRPLLKQWQREAKAFGIRIGRRSNIDLQNRRLRLDVSGVITTYAQVAQQPTVHASSVGDNDSVVIIDECHHPGDSRAWGEAIKDAFVDAKFRVLLSGTPFRSDGNLIPFVRFDKSGVSEPDYEYSYSQAIAEDHCRPVQFRPYEALIQYKRRGEMFAATFADDLPARQTSEVLKLALHPDAGLIERMVRDADDELSAIRSKATRFADAGALFVAMSQEHALECANVIERVTGEYPAVVLSDIENSQDDIDAFKDGMGRWIVAVRMISEGVDIPRLMVAVYGTNAVATLFFRQLVGRVVRTRHRGCEEVASIFMPADERLLKEASDIEVQVKQFLKDSSGDYAAIRADLARKERESRRANVVPFISQIEQEASVYRGHRFTEEEMDEAEAFRSCVPNGHLVSRAQLAFMVREIRLGRSSVEVA